jgi:trk system potassium uptake protein TrkA
MKALIVGAGRVGRETARVLAAGGHDVTLVEMDDDRVAELAGSAVGRLVPGDGCEPAILESSGALTADLLIAATGDDEDNLVISLLAKRQFAIPRVIARVNRAENAWLFDDAWGVDVPFSADTPLISLIEEAAGAAETITLLRLARAGVTVIETTIGSHSRCAGRPIAEVAVPEATVVAAVIRDGRPRVPDASFVLSAGDEVLLVTERATERDVSAAFQ